MVSNILQSQHKVAQLNQPQNESPMLAKDPFYASSDTLLPVADAALFDTALYESALSQPATIGEVPVDEMPIVVDNLINGTPDDDTLRGQGGTNSIAGFAGNDTLIGNQSLDILLGNRGDDSLRGRRGNDRLSGGNGNDRLHGGKNEDNLQGGRGNDKLLGGPGRDILRGDEGRDLLFGGRGSDVFILQTNLGRDRIRDFKVGQDKLGLADTIQFEDLSIRQRGNNTVIFEGTSRLAVLVNTDADMITANDFTRVIFTF